MKKFIYIPLFALLMAVVACAWVPPAQLATNTRVAPSKESSTNPTPVPEAIIPPTPSPWWGGMNDIPVPVTPNSPASYEQFDIRGVLDSVDSSNVLVANDGFHNTIGLGSEMLLAEPGVLLTHDSPLNEYQDRFSPLTQIPLIHPQQTQTGCGEGRIVWAIGNTLQAQIEDVTIFLPGMEGRNWWLIMRCRFSDQQPNTDAGTELVFTSYIPGFAQVMLFPAGAFLSEEAFEQALPATTGQYSCGSEGCTKLSVLFFDVNTDAWSLLDYSIQEGWNFVSSNWRQYSTR